MQTREAQATSSAQLPPGGKSNDWHLCEVVLQEKGPWQSLKLLQLSPILLRTSLLLGKGWQIEPAAELQNKPSSQLSGECRHLSPTVGRAREGRAVGWTGRGAVTAGAAKSGAAGATATGASTTGATGIGAAAGAIAFSFEVSGRVELVQAKHPVTMMTEVQTSRRAR